VYFLIALLVFDVCRMHLGFALYASSTDVDRNYVSYIDILWYHVSCTKFWNFQIFQIKLL